MKPRFYEIGKTDKEAAAALVLKETDVSIKSQDAIKVTGQEVYREFTDRALDEIS